MLTPVLMPIISLIACYGGPADHFATYAEGLKQQGYDVQIHATGPALQKFKDRGVEVKSSFSLDNLSSEEDHLAETIAKTCSTASIKKRFGIGYYPMNQAEKIIEKRTTDHDAVHSAFLIKNRLEDKGQKIFVYFGGNNEEYFLKKFPAFLSYLTEAAKQIDLKHIVIVIQQHPGAKVKNLDGQQLESCLKQFKGQLEMPKVLLSDFSSDHALLLADIALYYQTSMSALFALAKIPTVQIGHEVYELDLRCT